MLDTVALKENINSLALQMSIRYWGTTQTAALQEKDMMNEKRKEVLQRKTKLQY